MKRFVQTILLLLFVFPISGFLDQEDIDLVINGETEYSICLDPSAPESVRLAAEDLKGYFEKVTGASPEIIVTSQTCSPPFISLGQTAAAKAAGLETSDIPNDGYTIITKDKNIFILGPDTPTGRVNNLGGVCNGTANGVYTFIEDYLGVHWIMPGELGEEYSKVKTVTIPHLDRTEFSPFNYRNFTIVYNIDREGSDKWSHRMKLGEVAAVEGIHSWKYTIPASLFNQHPDWFARKNGKPLPPAGNYKLETTNTELVQAFADEIIETFRKNPDQRWYSLSPSDGHGWSDSPASLALTEKNPSFLQTFPGSGGNLSVTPLVLKFYNDVARIVGKEFPGHKLGGLIYQYYLYPPSGDIPEIEPNLSILLSVSAYGFKKYRMDESDKSGWMMWRWSRIAEENGIDIYFDDYATVLMQPFGVIWPAAPDILNFIYHRMHKYGFKGGSTYGSPVWPAFGAGNYAMAKLFWNPDQDAREIVTDYFHLAYGSEAGNYIEKIYELMDAEFRKLFNMYPKPIASPNVTEDMLKYVYGPQYSRIEEYYLKANEIKKEPRHQKRLELFGQVLSLMQWNLRSLGYLSEDFNSPLTRSDEQIDRLLSSQDDECRITRYAAARPPAMVELMPALPDARTQKASVVPIASHVQMVLYTQKKSEVTIAVKEFDPKAEFVTFTLGDAAGKLLRVGGMARDRTIRFTGEAGESYFLNIPSRRGSMKLEVEGASIAYSTQAGWPPRYIDGKYMDGPLPLYFYVPDGVNGFSVTLATPGAIVDIFRPDGQPAGQLDCTETNVFRLVLDEKNVRPGFWKMLIHKHNQRISLTIDRKLPQWFIPDPAHPLRILEE